jgi:hypothetical protein
VSIRLASGRPAAVLALIVLSGIVGAAPVAAADPTTFVVRSTGNAGDVFVGDDVCDADIAPGRFRCTLRAAIEEANGDPDEDRVEFRIGGARATGVQVIKVPAPGLPTVTAPLVIDGYTQPDSHVNTASRGTNARIRIVLDGPGTGTGVSGISAAATIVVRGLAIRDFRQGIEVSTGEGDPGDRSVIAGVFLGTDAAGRAARPNFNGIVIESADDVRIGGRRKADRNLISGALNDAIYFQGADRLRIQGDLIGTTADGRGTLGSKVGLEVGYDSVGVLVGGDSASKANTIAHSEDDGVLFYGDDSRVRFLRNSIFHNGGLAIDLEDDDVRTPNDLGPPHDVDDGANLVQNFPVLTSARTRAGRTVIRGRIESTADRDLRIEFFVGPAGTDEARRFIGSIVVRTDATGLAGFRFRPEREVRVGRVITATATDLVDQVTSEVCAPREVVKP